FVEAGYEAYQSIQESAGMDLAQVKARYGDRLTLWGGVRVENLLDTMLIEQVLTNGRQEGRRSLSELSEKYLGLPLDKRERTSFAQAGAEFTPGQLEYARRDLLATFHVLLEQMPAVVREGLEDTVRLECRAAPAFADLRYDGVWLDGDGWRALIEEARARRDQARAEVEQQLRGVAPTDLFGHLDLNLESEAELRRALTRLTGVELRDLGKAALKALQHPVAEPLVRYREMHKLVSTYGASFLEAIHPRTGRIHADFMQIGAPTGRVACRDPNLQNVPRGSRFRGCFRAPGTRRMVTADYAGCELRILAEASGDRAFVNTFQRGGDLHSIVAAEIFGQPVSKDRNPQLRERAKAINFGLAYGMGAAGLAGVTGMPQDEAERLLAQYFRAYPKVRDYLESSARLALERGYAETLGGRRLYLAPGEDMQGPELAGLARVAKNMPIQGTNADMLKIAMAGIRARLAEEGRDACTVNCVHDELLLEASADDAWDVAELTREEMVRAGERYISQVPVVVDVTVGEAWQK
ncbi:MAG TPA: DNA polymerase, partial [Myxococcota bacterium]|nr:DNA polymerase [Myxococcota bacterium]